MGKENNRKYLKKKKISYAVIIILAEFRHRKLNVIISLQAIEKLY